MEPDGFKYAYCIIVHKEWKQLQKLIDLIDDSNNDIFLHIDAKSLDAYHQYGYVKTKVSKLYILDNPIDVEWSDISLSDAEVALFKKVLESNVHYRYIHLLSGSDLPTVSQNVMHAFFDKRDEEFIEIEYTPIFKKRIKYYHFFVRGRRNNHMKNALRRFLLLPQWIFVDRLRHSSVKYAHGSEWCSLTMRAVREIVGKYQQYRYMFEKTTCSDTLYKQMILASAEVPFKYAKEGNLRYYRFEDGKASPRIVSVKDYDEIINSGCLFARKFELGTEVYDKVYQHVTFM